MKIFNREFKPAVLTVQILFYFLLLFHSVSCRDEGKTLSILSGSENESLEPLLNEFAKENNARIKVVYKGSVDIMMDLGKTDLEFDAVWPASTLWINLGDRNKKVKHLRSVMTSPVVFGIRKSLAGRLGFIDRTVRVRDILGAIQSKKLRFMMTSATQSNSGTSAYLGFVYALLGNPDIISEKDLNNPRLQTDLKALFQGINRSSGSSGWLKDLFLKGNYDAMVNYESVILETNRILASKGEEPLYIVYPQDGIVISDSPIGFFSKGSPKKEELFKKLQEYLLSPKIQEKILLSGRRVGLGGTLENSDRNVFNPEWGVDPDKILSPIKLPAAEVIRKALTMYQNSFRKKSLTVFCLDFSGSMKGNGYAQLKEAMNMLLDPEKASGYFLNFSSQDRVIVIPFNDQIIDRWDSGENEDIAGLNRKIQNLVPSGNTDIYSSVIAAMEEIEKIKSEDYSQAVILMTDGKSNSGKNFSDLKMKFEKTGLDIPVFSIMFGDASNEQLLEISELTRARVFDGRTDLIQAFRTAKGYN